MLSERQKADLSKKFMDEGLNKQHFLLDLTARNRHAKFENNSTPSVETRRSYVSHLCFACRATRTLVQTLG